MRLNVLSLFAGSIGGIELGLERAGMTTVGQASEWLAREPRVDRLADGIPRQVDRLRVIGNAVVPAVAEHIGRQLINALEGTAA